MSNLTAFLFLSLSLASTLPHEQATEASAKLEATIVFTATQIRAEARMAGVDCGQGLTTYTGHHSAKIISLNEAHENRTWKLRGDMLLCGVIFFSRISSCEVGGVAKTTSNLSCNTQRDFPCSQEVKAKSTGSILLVTKHTKESLCFSRHCEPRA